MGKSDLPLGVEPHGEVVYLGPTLVEGEHTRIEGERGRLLSDCARNGHVEVEFPPRPGVSTKRRRAFIPVELLSHPSHAEGRLFTDVRTREAQAVRIMQQADAIVASEVNAMVRTEFKRVRSRIVELEGEIEAARQSAIDMVIVFDRVKDSLAKRLEEFNAG